MTTKSKALTPSEIAAAQAIRSAYSALPSHPLKRWLPLRVQAIDGTERQMLVQQQKVNTDPRKESVLHLLVIRPGVCFVVTIFSPWSTLSNCAAITTWRKLLGQAQ